MVFKKILQKLKEIKETRLEKKSNQDYSDRFLKFYHNHKKRLLKERKSLYHEKKEKGICVRCKQKVLEGIIFCEHHQQKQVGYNKQARMKQ
ncbi:MAG TPA: hypothetical protein VJA18_05095 [Candidatus Nanoarchaeia archaeon]|nr:hypothetical protein [Candidatus Nanoarchaeia archaeon]